MKAEKANLFLVFSIQWTNS